MDCKTYSWGFEWVLIREQQVDAEDAARVWRVFLDKHARKKRVSILRMIARNSLHHQYQ